MKQLKPSKSSKNQLLLVIGALVILLGIVLYAANNSNSTPKSAPPSVSQNANSTLRLSPASKTVTGGSNLSIQIWENSYDQKVNAVQANLAYDPAKLMFLNIDASSSAFKLEVPSSGGNGEVKIGRGQQTPLTGNQLVAIVNFNVIGTGGSTSVSFASGSQLASATTNKNILAKTYGGNYNLGQ
jgi:hypothetical protein